MKKRAGSNTPSAPASRNASSPSSGDPKFCPHGLPIPAADLSEPDRIDHKLADVHAGLSARIVDVAEDVPEMLRFLDEIGIRPGAMVDVEAARSARRAGYAQRSQRPACDLPRTRAPHLGRTQRNLAPQRVARADAPARGDQRDRLSSGNNSPARSPRTSRSSITAGSSARTCMGGEWWRIISSALFAREPHASRVQHVRALASRARSSN